jgi:hypothetical protein
MVVAACCCVMLSCKHVLPSYCFMFLSVSIFAVSVSSITPTAIICFTHIPLSCKQPLEPLAAAPAA